MRLGGYPAWLARHSGRVALAAGALGIAATSLAVTLPLRTEFRWLLPDDQPSVVALERLSARRPAGAVVELGVASPSPEATRRFAADLAAALRRDLPRELLEEVDEEGGGMRRFVWEHRHLYAPLGDLERARDALERRLHPMVVGLDETPGEGALADLRRRLAEARALAERPPFVAEEGRLRMLVLRCPFGDTEPDRAAALLAAAEATVAALDPRAYHPELEVGFAGDPVTAALEHRLVIRDVGLSAALCLALVLAALLAAFRAPRLVLALSAALALGCAIPFAVARLAIGHLNTSTAFLGSVVAGNGINFGIILVARYLEERRAGAPHAPALERALAHTALPTLVAAAAAGTAYLSLIVTSFRGFSELGLIAGTGMAACWLASYTALPALLEQLERMRPLVVAAVSPAPAGRRPLPRAVPLAVVALTGGVGLYGAARLSADPFEDDLRALRSRSLPASAPGRWSRRLDAAFGRDQSGGFTIGAERPEDVAAVVAALERAERGVAPADRVLGRVDALPAALPGDPATQAAKLALLDDLARLAASVAARLDPGSEEARLLRELAPPRGLRPIGVANLPASVRRAFTERDGRVGLLLVVHPGPAFDNWSQRGIRRAVELLRGLALPDEVRARLQISGPEVIFVDMIAAAQRDGPRASLLALGLVLLLVAVAFRPGRDLVLTVAAILLGLLGMVGLMALLDVRLNFLNFIAIPITVGIGVDYPFNLMARHRQARASGAPERGLRETGGAVALSSLTTIIGYGVLLASDTGAIRSFGLAAVLGEVACIAAALGALPSLLALAGRLRTRSAPDPGGGECSSRS